MKICEVIVEQRRPSIREQIIAAVKKDGGNLDEYFVRFTDVDRLGYSDRQVFGRSPDIDDPKFDVDYIGAGQGRRALWFYPLKFYLKNREAYASEQPYVWLVRLKPDAWLQTVTGKTQQVEPAPEGQQRVGILRLSNTPAAIFFRPGWELVSKFYNYAGQHQRHGEIKGPPGPSFFDRVRGLDENFADGKIKGKSRPGRVKRAGASCQGSVTDLRARAKKYGGERGRMYHWCANMKSGRKKG